MERVLSRSVYRYASYIAVGVYLTVFSSTGADRPNTDWSACTSHEARIDVLRPMFSTVDVWIEKGVLFAYEGTQVELLAVGHGLTPQTKIALTTETNKRDAHCTVGVLSEYYGFQSVFTDDDGNVSAGVISMRVPSVPEGENHFFLCLIIDKTITDEDGVHENTTFLIHQGDKLFLMMDSKAKLIPLWLHCVCLVLFLALSALFSGLNLGLMSLDITELKVLQNCGTDAEKKYAKAIAPVRKRGNYLLCTLLFGNVLVNSSIAIFLDELGGGLVAVIASTVCIVIFGEIIPQALCSRHGLAVGAHTILITKMFMILTFPVSFPISKILDLILGQEFSQVYNREKLQELVKLADKHDIKNEEINIIQGALQLTKKTAADVMTPIDDVFMVDYNASLDYNTMSLIMNTGYTRIPVHESDRSNIVALLNVKDLAFVDPDDRIPLKTVCKFYNRPVTFVFDDTRLDLLLEEFKKGHSHMAFVQKIVSQKDRDPFNETVGLVTLEDIIEEIIQSEILDETDVVLDNRSKRRRHNPRRKDYTIFNRPIDSVNHESIPPQLALATFQFLSTSIEAFKEEFISGTVLKRLINQDIFMVQKYEDMSIDNLIYIAGKPVDYFVMILQGRCTVEVGKDSMSFECGPFTHFGSQALLIGGKEGVHRASAMCLTDISYPKHCAYVPDFTLKVVSDIQYVKVRRAQYLAATRATLLERRDSSFGHSRNFLKANDLERRASGGDAALAAANAAADVVFNNEWKQASHQISAKSRREERAERQAATLHGRLVASATLYGQRNFSSSHLDELRYQCGPAATTTAFSRLPPAKQVTFSRWSDTKAKLLIERATNMDVAASPQIEPRSTGAHAALLNSPSTNAENEPLLSTSVVEEKTEATAGSDS